MNSQNNLKSKRALPGSANRSASPLASSSENPDHTARVHIVRPELVSVPDGYLAVGLIVGIHGLRGEVKVQLHTDFPERFQRGVRLFIGEKLSRITIQGARPHKEQMLLKLQGIDQREQAEALRNLWLFVTEDDAVELTDDTYWVHDILGLLAVTEEGRELGKVIDVLVTGANDVYVVDMPDGELLIPAIAQVVQTVDLENERLVVRLLPGML